ncbi:tetraacyldisaccharide 4'-kinase [bacterium]|nr:MAG: tetraacyldisaccharide 4'-kinase [bacterium]
MKIVDRRPFYLKRASRNVLSMIFYPLRVFLSVLYYSFYLLQEIFVRRAARRRVFRKGEGRRKSKECTVISVGNIEVGGTGKTPISVLLSEELMKNGHRVVVVTRGYRRKGRLDRTVVIPAKGDELKDRCSSAEFSVLEAKSDLSEVIETAGDEAAIYVCRSIPIIVGKDKARSIDLAKRLFAASRIIMDDGFQHLRAHRDIDILLLDHRRPFGNGLLLPAGTLREPPFAAERADVIVFTRSSSNTVPEGASRYVKGKPCFFSKHVPLGLMDRNGDVFPLDHLKNKAVTIFSGLARNESFEEMMAQIGAVIGSSFRFSDHYNYSAQDVEKILKTSGRTIVVTTEKDIGKVTDIFPGDVELYALRIGIEVERLNELIELLS